MNRLGILAILALAACQQDETLSAYLGDTDTFELQTLNGIPFAPGTTLSVSEDGELTGKAPCNNFSMSSSVPYPWIDIGPIRSTRMACAELVQEQQFFDLLSKMQFAEVSGPTLVLSNEAGEELVFYATP